MLATDRCAHNQCRHSLSEHSDYGCDARILTVLDTEGRCPCVAFTTDPEDSWRNLRDYQGLITPPISEPLCRDCGWPLRAGETEIHPECVAGEQSHDPDEGRCRSCGAADDRYCPCTTGQSSTYFTRDML